MRRPNDAAGELGDPAKKLARVHGIKLAHDRAVGICRLLAPLGQQASLDQEGERDSRRTTTSMTVSPAFLPSSRAVWALSTTAAVDSTGTVLGGWKGTGFSGR